jgi:phosphonopyruvate decarboxylase
MSTNAVRVFEEVKSLGFDFFTGVPDSLLKDFCQVISEEVKSSHHVITANEGNAIALSTGYYLATGRPGFVYMQNSGIGNAVNPLLSLADPEVYGIPMLIMIGWRGEPGKKDEPQHEKQGRVIRKFLDALEMPFVDFDRENSYLSLSKAAKMMHELSRPVAILVPKDSIVGPGVKVETFDEFRMSREEAIKLVIENFGDNAFFVSTTGMTSRELWELRQQSEQDGNRDFLTVGSMGHASSIALGLSIAQPQRQIICLDGDGAAIMHMGSIAINGQRASDNFLHILINNGAHDSVGGQPTVGKEISFTKIAESSGYKFVSSATSATEIDEFIRSFIGNPRRSFLEILVRTGSRPELGRPTDSPEQNRRSFMKAIM